MRPGVVRADRTATRGPALSGEDQTVVAGRPTRVDLRHETIVLSRLRILKNQAAALLLIGCRGTRGVADSIERAWAQSQIDGRIVLLRRPQMDGVSSQVARRYEPT